MNFLSPIAGLLLAAAVLPPLLLLWFLKAPSRSNARVQPTSVARGD